MSAQPTQMYAAALTSSVRHAEIDDPAGGRAGGPTTGPPDGAVDGRLHLRYADGGRVAVPVHRWAGPVDAVDDDLLGHCASPTLDVGCGPGRFTAALALRGTLAVGVDITAVAVRLARRAGATAWLRSVFDPLPGEGSWATVLLADGNVGIGGDVGRLLRRCAALLTPDGRVLVELDPPGTRSRAVQIRLETATACSDWFDWAHLAADDVGHAAGAAGLTVRAAWHARGRWFASLGSP